MVKAAKGALLATLEVDRNSGAPIYRQIEDFLRRMILNGALPPSQKLPSTRELALELGVSRITIKSVYEQLISEGYVQGKTGAGTFVSEGLDGETPVVPSIDLTEKEYLFGNFCLIIALGTNGAPGILTSALITNVFTDSRFVLPPTTFKYLFITSKAVNPSGISLLNIGFAIGFAY